MTSNTKQLLLIVLVLLGVQWLLVPLISWQNQKVARLEQSLSTIASRAALTGAVPQLQAEVVRRAGALDSLADLSFAQGPTSSLEMQRWVTSSLENRKLMIEKFEWSPKTPGALSITRAKVGLRGNSEDLLEWMVELQAKTPWVNVLALDLRPAGRQRRDLDMFAGSITLQFVLSGKASD